MNPLIALAAKHVPFSPVEYTWFDLTNLKKSYDSMMSGFKNRPLDDFVHDGLIENLPMPFESIACIMATTSSGNFPVTIDRSTNLMENKQNKNILTFAFWAKDIKQPASICTYQDSIYNNISMRFDHGFERRMIAEGHKNYVQSHREAVSLLLWAIIGISIGAANEEVRTAHRCIANPKNHQRMKRGKSPLFEWQTVVIRPPENKTSVSLGGTHASPKPHDRRGHQRRYKSGKVVYIRSTTINKHKIAEEGFIHHDYKVTA